jgi:hypothetical protein
MMTCYIASICFLVPLSIISLTTAYWALQALDFGTLRNERPMIYVMEICCQIIILTRLATTLTQQYIPKDSMMWAYYLLFYFIFSELIPFLIIALKINRKFRKIERSYTECRTESTSLRQTNPRSNEVDDVSESDNQVIDMHTRGTCTNTQYGFAEDNSNVDRLASFG